MSGNQTKVLCIKPESGAFGACALNIEYGIATLQDQSWGQESLWGAFLLVLLIQEGQVNQQFNLHDEVGLRPWETIGCLTRAAKRKW